MRRGSYFALGFHRREERLNHDIARCHHRAQVLLVCKPASLTSKANRLRGLATGTVRRRVHEHDVLAKRADRRLDHGLLIAVFVHRSAHVFRRGTSGKNTDGTDGAPASVKSIRQLLFAFLFARHACTSTRRTHARKSSHRFV